MQLLSHFIYLNNKFFIFITRLPPRGTQPLLHCSTIGGGIWTGGGTIGEAGGDHGWVGGWARLHRWAGWGTEAAGGEGQVGRWRPADGRRGSGWGGGGEPIHWSVRKFIELIRILINQFCLEEKINYHKWMIHRS